MKHVNIVLMSVFAFFSLPVLSEASPATHFGKHRLIIMADMGNEPDEMQQMIHMMTYANEFDIEGLIAVTGKYMRPGSPNGPYYRVTHPELFIEIIDAYSEVYENLKQHASGWPTPEYLRKKVKVGQKGYGIEEVKVGNGSPGSELILTALSKDDPRPIWVVVNAGSNTLAQALVDYQSNHTKAEMDELVSKLRVFENGAQDNAGAWICHNFPDIHWIRSNFQTYSYGGPTLHNLGPNYWHPYETTTQGQLKWLQEHVMDGHGALGDLYPVRQSELWPGITYFMEGGGTIPWMGLVNKGLFDINQPSWGGWGGRFSKEKVANFWSRHKDIKAMEKKSAPFYTHREASDHWVDPQDNKVYNSNYAPVWRWREAMYNDQIARMDWSVKPFDKANHNPIAAVNGDLTNTIIRIKASPEQVIQLDASASQDPDGDKLKYSWWMYQEAGTYAGKALITDEQASKTSLTIPSGAAGSQIHIILELQDINEIVPLFDYRRIVIDVEK